MWDYVDGVTNTPATYLGQTGLSDAVCVMGVYDTGTTLGTRRWLNGQLVTMADETNGGQTPDTATLDRFSMGRLRTQTAPTFESNVYRSIVLQQPGNTLSDAARLEIELWLAAGIGDFTLWA